MLIRKVGREEKIGSFLRKLLGGTQLEFKSCKGGRDFLKKL